MKTFLKSASKILPFAFLGLLACNDPKEDIDPVIDPPSYATGDPMPVGKPIGSPITKTIGPGGGTIEIPENRIVFKFAAGVVSKETAITIQPVENTAPIGIGTSYELTPKDTPLAKDAQVTWTYTDEDINGTTPEALAVAYQDEKGIWQGSNKVTLDKTAKTVTAPVSRIAHWTFYAQFKLESTKSVFAPGDNGEFYAQYQEGVDTDDWIAPLVLPKKVRASMVVKWTLNGNKAGNDTDGDYATLGQLTEDGTFASAKYDAPPREPDVNPVAVGVELDLKQYGHVQLIKYARIESAAYLKLEGLYDDNPVVGLTLHGSKLTGIIQDKTMTRMMVVFNIDNFHGKGTYEIAKDHSVQIAPRNGGKVPYLDSYYDFNAKWISGGGKITITEYKGPGQPVGGTLSGGFFEPFLDGTILTHQASAKFRGLAVVY